MGFSKEHAIIAQNSATVAAALVGPGATVEQFEEVRRQVFNGTLALAGAESVVEAFESPTSVAQAVAAPTYPQAAPAYEPFPQPSPSFDPSGPGGVELKFGKYKGQTIAQVWADPTPDPRSGEPAGRGWLEWAAANTNNDFVKSKIREFLATAARA